ncbi:hypothetical protein BSX36_06095 [Listeria monocytogenes]|uniref:hypothetical protein n=1 Tax=Listeria monocytogenes TaxID=1639 RepID=UPI000874D355|nr:hypothetical protein [Listeria monocytogenes]EAD5400629.1 hypothetical protein [Listeria monocytogenes]EAE8619712.1 hypothetical protein [Listeria monocytogenes]EAE8622155.1 hypothetical protein [Listeria monocytogenes]EAE8629592.1 hypothetical protein [Listeria monocytogenes]EAE8630930.1 hypothetical protein [Listeria monocytogenes]
MDLAELIQENNLLCNDPEYKSLFNMLSAGITRIETSIEYLKAKKDRIETEDDLSNYIVNACYVLETIKLIMKNLKIESIYKEKNNAENLADAEDMESYKFFKEVAIGGPLYIDVAKCPTDNQFFEYFRSLSTMHPADTSRPKFLREREETHYSPFVIVENTKLGKRVGAQIYSNKSDEILNLLIPLDQLNNYINSRFLQIQNIIDKLKQICKEKEDEWRKEKVKVESNIVDTLKNIKQILECRFEDTYEVDLAIQYLECELTIKVNSGNVNNYRNEITNRVQKIVEAVDELDYNRMLELLSIVSKPKNLIYKYELEKIFDYLNEESEYVDKYNIALDYAKRIATSFASEWVQIDCDKMTPTEIKLLLLTAFYMDENKQF